MSVAEDMQIPMVVVELLGAAESTQDKALAPAVHSCGRLPKETILDL